MDQGSLPPAACSPSAPSRARRELFARLRALGIAAPTVPYPGHGTVEEGRALRGQMAGCFTKNLLLCDKRGKLFLVVAQEERAIDLKTLHRLIGASGRLGFAPGEQMRALLGVEPGALTPLALLFDRERQVTSVIDRLLLGEKQVKFHPLVNTQSTGVAPEELLRFIRSCGREPLLVFFDDPSAAHQPSSEEPS
jgi:Ala-tRNA(Pro) deacylase